MKFIIPFLLLIFGAACVQKAYNRTVVYHLSLRNMKNVQSVAIRGDNLPLSWSRDFNMEVVKPDTLYQATVTYRTGYTYTEVKFVVNDVFEFSNKPNRKVVFTSDTTHVYAVYDKE